MDPDNTTPALPIDITTTPRAAKRVTSRSIPAAPTNFRDQAVAISQLEGDVPEPFRGYVSRVFTQTSLPYRDPMASNPDLRAWERRNGSRILAVEPARVTSSKGEVTYEMPFGKYPRLLLPWLTTQIVLQQQNRESDGRLPIEITSSLPKFMADLGQEWGGRKGKLLNEQLPRLFGAKISVTEFHSSARGEGVRARSFQISDDYDLWWGRGGKLQMGGLWGNKVVCTSQFVDDVLDAEIPIDLRALALMAQHGPMAMDILTWMNYRLPRASARSSAVITWEQLHNQFGAQYKHVRMFKANFLKKLADVTTVYRDARVDVEPGGLRLFHSPPMVPRKRPIAISRRTFAA